MIKVPPVKEDDIRDLLIPLYDPNNPNKVVKKISIGELIDTVSTFTTGNILRALRDIRDEVDKRATEKGGGLPLDDQPVVNKSVIYPGGSKPKKPDHKFTP